MNEELANKDLEALDALLPKGVSKEMPYRVPDGYFDALGEVVATYTTQQTGEEWLAPVKVMPYEVPLNYFEGNIEVIGNVPLESMLPAHKPQGYSVPQGYFESLPASIAGKIQLPPARKPDNGKSVGQWRHWLLAASVLLLVGISGGYYFYGMEVRKEQAVSLVASLPEQEIVSYLKLVEAYPQQTDVVVDVSGLPVSDGEIVDYLNETGWE